MYNYLYITQLPHFDIRVNAGNITFFHSVDYRSTIADQVNLTDRYVLLLNDLVKENRALNKEVENSTTKNEERITSLVSKIDNLHAKLNAPSRRVRQTGGGRLRVPRLCSVSTLFNLLLYQDFLYTDCDPLMEIQPFPPKVYVVLSRYNLLYMLINKNLNVCL